MKKVLLYLLLALPGLLAQAQTDSPATHKVFIPGRFSDLQVDNLGNIYVLDEENRLEKLNSAGDSLAVFNDVRRFGRLSYIDVSNPLKILLYYQEFSTIVMLDRLLTRINSIDLRKFNYVQVKCIGLGYDNNIWIYDEVTGTLKRIADDGSLLLETTDIRQMASDVPDPVSLTDQGGQVYLFDPELGAYQFDHYGGFHRFIPLKHWDHFSVVDNKLVGWTGSDFLRYDAAAGETRQAIPAAWLPAKKMVIRPDYIYTLKTDGIHVYKN